MMKFAGLKDGEWTGNAPVHRLEAPRWKRLGGMRNASFGLALVFLGNGHRNKHTFAVAFNLDQGRFATHLAGLAHALAKVFGSCDLLAVHRLDHITGTEATLCCRTTRVYLGNYQAFFCLLKRQAKPRQITALARFRKINRAAVNFFQIAKLSR